jgi:hypothetical protein
MVAARRPFVSCERPLMHRLARRLLHDSLRVARIGLGAAAAADR